MSLTVSQVARLAGVSVRTLHHYDEIDLLRPTGRSEAGYRLYEQTDLQRLQQVLFFKELGFPLEEITRILKDPAFDLRAALLMQRQLLTERATRVKALIGAVDAALESLEKGTVMTKEEMFEVFGDFDPAKYEDEARERWGNTEAYKESARRTSRYTKKDWQQIKAEGEEIMRALVAHLDAGRAPTEPAVMEVAERHRAYITKWFYPCSHEIHRGLGELYVNDPRFTANIDKDRPGLAQYTRDVFLANAERASRS
ncbi:MerR family transcriptional regulator [Hyalangium gracile]|uniref:MerR family transcriptional regulator n=1 Tax=Hyalangium gracile TaxID=394092 RepID=UPI001CCD6B9F|nr:MerR family transcriptional regulator [Hyalangium gracile]